MDYADESALAAEQHFAASMAKIMRPVFGESKEACDDCGEPIPEARRLAVPGCTRCIDCQEDYENELREEKMRA